jgi:hypothetical protein
MERRRRNSRVKAQKKEGIWRGAALARYPRPRDTFATPRAAEKFRSGLRFLRLSYLNSAFRGPC